MDTEPICSSGCPEWEANPARLWDCLLPWLPGDSFWWPLRVFLFKQKNNPLPTNIKCPALPLARGLARWAPSLGSTMWTELGMCTIICHSNVMFLSTFPSSYSNRKITREFFLFCSSVEDACKCSITASTMQLWWHVMALFPNSLSHNKRSSNHSDRHNDRLPFYLTCNLPRKLRQKLLSTFVKHKMRGVCTKPIKKRIAFCGFFPGALFWKLTSIY